MASPEVAIAINSRTRDIIEEWQLVAPHEFSMTLSSAMAESLDRGVTVREAIDRALLEVGTAFKNANLDRLEEFRRELANRLSSSLPARQSVADHLRDFKAYAERELVHGFKGKNRNEEFCRSNLQTFLQRLGETRREKVSGGGLIDILVATGEPVEAKLWDGQEYYEGGVEELREYMRTEKKTAGYYVVFDTLPDNLNLLDEKEIPVSEGRILQLAVRMSPGPPSKKRVMRLGKTGFP